MKYKIRLTRDITESVDVMVDAESAAEAKEKALTSSVSPYKWEVNEGNRSRVYIADEENDIQFWSKV